MQCKHLKIFWNVTFFSGEGFLHHAICKKIGGICEVVESHHVCIVYSLYMQHVREGLVLIVLAEVHCIGGPLGTLAWLASSPSGIIQTPMM